MRTYHYLTLFLLSIAIFPLFASGVYEDREFPVENQRTLTVYSPHDSQPLYTAVKEFQEITGISVNVVSSGTGELLERIRRENEEGEPLCDVFWGGGAESIAANADLFEPFTSVFDDWIPKESKDPNFLWVGESPAPVVIIYNTILVSPEEVPTAWSDLLLPKWRGKIACARPGKSGSAYTLLCTMLTAFGGEEGEGWPFIRKFVGISRGSYWITQRTPIAWLLMGPSPSASVRKNLRRPISKAGHVWASPIHKKEPVQSLMQ